MIKPVFQGMLIGVAGIVPGVSGGTLALSMGIYDKLIKCVTHIFKDVKESIRFLMPIAVGMAISMMVLSLFMESAFEKVPVSMGCLFTGLVMGGLPKIRSKTGKEKTGRGHVITCMIVFFIFALLPFLTGADGNEASLYGTVADRLKLFFVGILASATMVIPGVSGSVLLLMLGYYTPVIKHINIFIRSMFSLNVMKCIEEIVVLLPFAVGVALGGFLIAKVIEFIFNRIPIYAYWSITGLILSSPVSIMMSCIFSGKDIRFYDIIAAVPALITGGIVAAKLGD